MSHDIALQVADSVCMDQILRRGGIAAQELLEKFLLFVVLATAPSFAGLLEINLLTDRHDLLEFRPRHHHLHAAQLSRHLEADGSRRLAGDPSILTEVSPLPPSKRRRLLGLRGGAVRAPEEVLFQRRAVLDSEEQRPQGDILALELQRLGVPGRAHLSDAPLLGLRLRHPHPLALDVRDAVRGLALLVALAEAGNGHVIVRNSRVPSLGRNELLQHVRILEIQLALQIQRVVLQAEGVAARAHVVVSDGGRGLGQSQLHLFGEALVDLLHRRFA
mmetsp:Transcript_81160/g.211775  ORF Transcript_81160/g.211775 Transcript_81160/m.211775 type:complete len:275 (+) Transcript_81160:504-1328(+)